VALTGVAFPIALSFSLQSLASATPLQAFAAGASLCSTSLGTTFAVLSTSGLSATRLGVVLTTAAMMDDVVGLVMVQVISNLGDGALTPITVVRPIAVSIGFGIVILLGCRFIVKPVSLWINSKVNARQGGRMRRTVKSTYTPFVAHTTILFGLVTGATYAGTSNLFAAYLAGASISWWDSEFSWLATPTNNAGSSHGRTTARTDDIAEAPSESTTPATVKEPASAPNPTSIPIPAASASGAATFELFYGPILHRVLKPLFFASIGFAIPISKLFSGPIIWRGVIYTLLMLFAKLLTGIWLVRFSRPIFPNLMLRAKGQRIPSRAAKEMGKKVTDKGKEPAAGDPGNEGLQLQDMSDRTSRMATNESEGRKRAQRLKGKHISRPLSLYPAAILGTAMTARGEIGFLIASLAETTGVFSSGISTGSASEIYLIATWAIMLCTIIGPLSVGMLVKRVRQLDRDLDRKGGNGRDGGPLGIWGVD
jgi:Kef-type K+ transport system membrane component KefB